MNKFRVSRASLVALVVKNLPANGGDSGNVGSVPGSGRSPGEGNSNPLQHSCLENSMDRGAWWAIVWGRKESDMTEQLAFSLFKINQSSDLEWRLSLSESKLLSSFIKLL